MKPIERLQMISMLARALAYPTPYRAELARRLIQKFSLFSYRDRLEICAVDRPHYGHCIFEAAHLAARLGHSRISVIEFGCGGGNGLLNAEMHIAEVEKIYPVTIELYGFDSGTGLPPLKDYRDFPHYFMPGQFNMDADKLRQKLLRGKLVLGNVIETCKTFFADFSPAPIACIFHDLDFYSSTRDALSLFDADPAHFLPRVFMYFDDTVGNDNTWLVSEFAGELLAIEEFNQEHATQKIAANRYLQIKYPAWGHQIYIRHDFHHPQYNVFVADDAQRKHEKNIKLR
jgi:hypothetical protein